MLKEQLRERSREIPQEVTDDARGRAAESGTDAEDEDERGGEVDGELVLDGEDVVEVDGVHTPGHRTGKTLCED